MMWWGWLFIWVLIVAGGIEIFNVLCDGGWDDDFDTETEETK